MSADTRTTMSATLSLALILSAGVYPGETGHAAPQPSTLPAWFVLDDLLSNAGLTSDGFGAYKDGTDCVNSDYSPGRGYYNLVMPSGLQGCSPTDATRTMTLMLAASTTDCVVSGDKGAGPLNLCGTNVVRGVRLHMPDLYKAPTSDLTLGINPTAVANFTAFTIEFVNPATVTTPASGWRQVDTTSAPQAAIYQFKVQANGKVKKILLGSSDVPVRFTVCDVAACT